MNKLPIKVIYFMRKKGSFFSLERVFDDISQSLSSDVNYSFRYSRFYSKGFFRRFYDLCTAPFAQGDINHITGDVHFVSYFLNKNKTILTIHDTGIPGRIIGARHWLYWLFWLRLPSWKCKYIVAISKSTKDSIINLLPDVAEKVKVIPNPVSTVFTPNFRVFNEVTPRILHIGVTENKNFERHLDAVSGLHCTFVIVGELTSYQRKLLKASNVDFKVISGLTNEEMLEQYQLSDILLFASTSEGFGLPILEGQAVGRPVVTSNIDPMSDVAGEGACLVDPYSSQSIRKGLKRIIENSQYRHELVSKGFENIKKFSPAAVAECYESLYREITNS